MSNFTKSIVYSGVVLAVGLIAIFAIRGNMEEQAGGFATVEPAAGQEEGYFETMPEETTQAREEVEHMTEEAMEETSEAMEEAAEMTEEAMEETSEETVKNGAEDASETEPAAGSGETSTTTTTTTTTTDTQQ